MHLDSSKVSTSKCAHSEPELKAYTKVLIRIKLTLIIFSIPGDVIPYEKFWNITVRPY